MAIEPRKPPSQLLPKLQRALGGRAGWSGFVLQLLFVAALAWISYEIVANARANLQAQFNTTSAEDEADSEWLIRRARIGIEAWSAGGSQARRARAKCERSTLEGNGWMFGCRPRLASHSEWPLVKTTSAAVISSRSRPASSAGAERKLPGSSMQS